ncbi:MAG: hypothetical protein ABIG84_03650 [archaeon]
MKTIDILKTIEKYPLITFNEFIKITGTNPEYARTYLSRLKKDNRIYTIEKGKYTTHDDPLLFSSYIATPSYISYWTALRYHNLTEQLPKDIMIATPRSKDTITFQKTDIRFFKTKHMWGYRKHRYRDFDIFMAEKEKSIIDCLSGKNTPFDEIIKAIATKEYDHKKIIEYALKTKNNSLIKRLGYLLEHFGIKTGNLKSHIDNNYIPLDPGMPKKGTATERWKIIINRRLDDID